MKLFTRAIILTSATAFFGLLVLAQGAGATPLCQANNDKYKTCPVTTPSSSATNNTSNANTNSSNASSNAQQGQLQGQAQTTSVDVHSTNRNDVDVNSVNINATKSVSDSSSDARSTSNAKGGVGYGGLSNSSANGGYATSTQSASIGGSSSVATGGTNSLTINEKHEASKFFPALAPAAYGTSTINGASRSTAGLYINAGVSEVAGSFAAVGVSVPLTSDAHVKRNMQLQNRLLELQVQYLESLMK